MTIGDAIFSIFMICLMIIVGLIVFAIAAIGVVSAYYWMVENHSIPQMGAVVIIGFAILIVAANIWEFLDKRI